MKEVKTSIDALEIGMYVSNLDKPWIESPFLLEGLRINSQEDIDSLRGHAEYVYVDIDEGPAPKIKLNSSTSSKKESAVGTENTENVSFDENSTDYEKLKKVIYQVKTTFKDELKNAKGIKQRFETNFKKIFDNINNDEEIYLDDLKEDVRATVDSIIRNPSAFDLLAQLEKSNAYAYGHALSTSVLCAHFGRYLGLEKNDIEELALGGMLLDLGKVQISNEILEKTSNISIQERINLQQHVELGLNKLSYVEGLSNTVLDMVATHHERANGRGYPKRLKNEEIPLYGRIAGIVDSYDAMISDKPYGKTLSPNDAINELYKLRGSEFDAELVEKFIQTIGLYPTGSLVELSNGAVAIVLEIDEKKRLHPTVLIVLNQDKEDLDEFQTTNLAVDNPTGIRVKKALPSGSFGINIEEYFL